jgi:hypothetical protein
MCDLIGFFMYVTRVQAPAQQELKHHVAPVSSNGYFPPVRCGVRRFERHTADRTRLAEVTRGSELPLDRRKGKGIDFTLI